MLNTLIEQRMKLKKQIDEIEELKKKTEAQIKLLMEQKNINEYTDDIGNYVTYKDIITRRLDKKIVESKLAPEIFNQCFKTTTSTRLTIITPEEKERRSNFKKT